MVENLGSGLEMLMKKTGSVNLDRRKGEGENERHRSGGTSPISVHKTSVVCRVHTIDLTDSIRTDYQIDMIFNIE